MAITEQNNVNLVFFWVSCKSNPPNLKIKTKRADFKCCYNVSVPVRVLQQGVPFDLIAHASSKYKFR